MVQRMSPQENGHSFHGSRIPARTRCYLESLTPFAVAYFTVIYFLERMLPIGPVALSIIAGSFFAVYTGTDVDCDGACGCFLLVQGA